MPTMPPEAANRPKPKMPYSQDFSNLPKPVVPKTENRKLLKGQKAIVTGASSGIGRSIALALGHAGADVCINYVTGADKAQAMVDELNECGHTAFAHQADVSKEDQVGAVAESHRRQSHWPVSLRTRSGSRIQTPGRETRSFVCRRKNHLHQFG